METKKIFFNNRDGIKLSCNLDFPQGQPKAYALFVHCFTCSKNIKAVYHISHTLASKGIACLRFDFTGIEQSEGNFEDTNFTSDVYDIIDAAKFLTDQYKAPSIIIGHSLGGTAAIKASREIKSVKSVVTINAPFEPSHIIKLINRNTEINYKGTKQISLGEKRFLIRDSFIEDFKKSDISDDISNLRRALLIMHAPLDNIVSIKNASKIFINAKHPKSFISLDNSDHLLSDKMDSIYAGRIISEWASRYILDTHHPKEAKTRDNKVMVHTAKDSLKSDLFIGPHYLIADEPISVGGTDQGPNPYDYLLASLGSCTTMTVMMYAKRKGWNLESVEVSLNHTKIHATDCEECESQSGKVDYIERHIYFLGNLNYDQRKRLSEIADKCPVHRTLHSEIVIKTTIIE